MQTLLSSQVHLFVNRQISEAENNSFILPIIRFGFLLFTKEICAVTRPACTNQVSYKCFHWKEVPLNSSKVVNQTVHQDNNSPIIQHYLQLHPSIYKIITHKRNSPNESRKCEIKTFIIKVLR